MLQICSCCGSDELVYNEVLWRELTEEWKLDEYQQRYINIQQGYHCKKCFNNIRTMALAKAISQYFGYKETLLNNMKAGMLSTKRILEINEAGNLTQFLKMNPHHEIMCYPELDMQDMNIKDSTYDIIIHSDTLEHVPSFIKALKECHRVLKEKGVMFFTVPLLVERLSESREGKNKVYHGDQQTRSDAFVVRTEFGADIWTYVIESGFSNCTFFCLEYPSGIVLTATK